ncbi:MAG: hypothetical protein JSV44_00770 [Candidatus Zixiibacteriota bacterium]|nr:MAG: hypothetical protein JSV44_00770 [candidate division Zixibacteria bacterium]
MSKLLQRPSLGNKVIIGEYRADIEADRRAAEMLTSVFLGINVITSTEGKKLVPIQELLKVEEQIRREKDQIHRDSYETGHSEGYNKGLAKGHKEAEAVINNFASVVKNLIDQREAIYEDARRQVLELVLQMARKVTFEAARIDPEVTAKIINGAINSLVNKSHIKVKVNPDQLPLIEQQIDRFKGDTTVIKDITIEPDRRVRYGGCFLETPTGDIDARVESQMDIIAEALIVDEDQE